jgi:malonyl CoA-acyl carrier protein transacylase
MKNKFFLSLALINLLFNLNSCQRERSAAEIEAAKDQIIKDMELIRDKYGLTPSEVIIDEKRLEEFAITGKKADVEELEKVFKQMQEQKKKSEGRQRFYEEVVRPEVQKAKTKAEWIQVAKKYPEYVSVSEE